MRKEVGDSHHFTTLKPGIWYPYIRRNIWQEQLVRKRKMEKPVTLILCNNSASKHTDNDPQK